MILEELEELARSRRGGDIEASYTARLLADPELISRKVMEEAFEVCLEFGRTEVSGERVASEAADLLYHLLVGLAAADVPLADVFTELESRRS